MCFNVVRLVVLVSENVGFEYVSMHAQRRKCRDCCLPNRRDDKF